MIIDAIISVLLTAVTFVFGLFPEFVVPDISSSLGETSVIFQYLGWGNHFLPLDTLFTIVGLMVTFYATIHIAGLVIWVLSKAHILGGGSS